jgi:hypothetical protein
LIASNHSINSIVFLSLSFSLINLFLSSIKSLSSRSQTNLSLTETHIPYGERDFPSQLLLVEFHLDDLEGESLVEKTVNSRSAGQLGRVYRRRSAPCARE